MQVKTALDDESNNLLKHALAEATPAGWNPSASSKKQPLRDEADLLGGGGGASNDAEDLEVLA